ncbi:MAG: hypothetical protein NXI31_22555 [bacterium]|nr:hypothetical protein [bacterium]
MPEIERVAQQGCFALDVCSCDRATLSVGPVSLRLERSTVDELAKFLKLASRRLVVRDEHGKHWREIVRAPDLESGHESDQ